MIEFTEGDVLKADVEALVNTVNCVGVMGRGVALQFKNAYPLNFKEYKKACDLGEVVPGRMLVHETGMLTNPKYIINFPTKRHWKGMSRLEDIESGLNALSELIGEKNIKSIAIPPLGSGLGGLNWSDVRKLIEAKLSVLEGVKIVVYEPTGATPFTRSTEVPAMTTGRAAMIKLMNRYLAGLMDPFVTLLEVQKLMYFLQESGEPLRLKYEKGLYGPYAVNLRHVLNAMEGHFISGYGDGGDAPNKHLMLVPGAIKDADNYLDSPDRSTKTHLDKVFELVDGFETGFGLELLATVHWILRHDKVVTDEELIEKVYDWNSKKQKFNRSQIVLASNTLRSNGWI